LEPKHKNRHMRGFSFHLSLFFWYPKIFLGRESNHLSLKTRKSISRIPYLKG